MNKHMTKEQEEIFAKEVLTINDVSKLFEISHDSAAKLIRRWKMNLRISGSEIRLKKRGKIHMQDYLDANNLNIARYYPAEWDEKLKENINNIIEEK